MHSVIMSKWSLWFALPTFSSPLPLSLWIRSGNIIYYINQTTELIPSLAPLLLSKSCHFRDKSRTELKAHKLIGSGNVFALGLVLWTCLPQGRTGEWSDTLHMQTFTGATVNAGRCHHQYTGDGEWIRLWLMCQWIWLRTLIYLMWSESAPLQCRLCSQFIKIPIHFYFLHIKLRPQSEQSPRHIFKMSPKSPSLLLKHKEIQLFRYVCLLPANCGAQVSRQDFELCRKR